MKFPALMFLGLHWGAPAGPAESPLARLSLAQFRQQALAQSPTVRQYQGRLEEARYGLDSAQEAVRIARLLYRNGLGTNVELLDSEAAFTSAQQEQVIARYRYQQTLARYRRATAQATPGKDGGVL